MPRRKCDDRFVDQPVDHIAGLARRNQVDLNSELSEERAPRNERFVVIGLVHTALSGDVAQDLANDLRQHKALEH